MLGKKKSVNMVKQIILGAIFLFSIPVYSQFVIYGYPETVNTTVINNLTTSARGVRDSLIAKGYTAETFTIQQVNDKFWMTIDGRLDVFEWNDNHWENLYVGTFHGYNFKGHQFVLEDRLFSYGGYGFWREHGEIIEFLPEKGEWEIIPASKKLPYGIGYMDDSVLYIHAPDCYEVDLKYSTAKSVKCRYDIRGEIPHGRIYNFQDYILIASFLNDGSQFPLIDKQTNNVYLSQRQPFKGLRDSRVINSTIYIHNNDMTIFYPDGSIVEYDVGSELQYYEKESTKSNRSSYWFLGLLLFIGGVATWYFQKSKRGKGNTSEFQIFEPFKPFAGELINSEQLDVILKIDDINIHETRKHKRSALVNEINMQANAQFGKDLIVRERDPNDKRFYLYRIQNL
jgi:hypothetical protein